MFESILISAFALLAVFLIPTFVFGKTWGNSISNLLYANRSLKLFSTALAINSHWFWAIAIFISPAVAYNWGIIGLLWFVIPNAISLLVVGYLTNKFRDNNPDSFSLTEFIKEKYGKSIVVLLYIMYICIAFAGILLGFTAIFKFFTFLGISSLIQPIYIVLMFGLATLAFTLKGGIRTSIFTGSTQTILWLLFLSFCFGTIMFSDYGLITFGKNGLETIFHSGFLTNFAVSFLISILVGATSHGMMWQKSFSIDKQNILPSYTIASIIFAIMVFMMGSLGLFAFANGIQITSPDTSQLSSVAMLFGNFGIIIFGTLLIGQTCTVIDSCLNYFSSVNTIEWFKKDSVTVARFSMLLFFALAWVLTWANLEVWTIFMLMSVLRISLFTPIVSMVHNINYNVKFAVPLLIFGIVGSFLLSLYARMNKMPIFDMYSALFAFIVSIIAIVFAYKFNK
jgi:Na+/proline symporter